MLKGVLLAGRRGGLALPALRSTAAALGGIRTNRSGRGGRGDEDDESQMDFFAANAPQGRGRGQGTYKRFLTANKEIVVRAESKQYNNFRGRRGGEQFEDAEGDGDVDEEDETALMDMGLPGVARTEEQQEQQKEEMRKRQASKGEDEGDTYFDWEDEDLFIPGLPETDSKGRMTTDTVNREDNERVRFGKLLWRRIIVQTRDLDRNATFSRSDTVMEALQEFRELKAQGVQLVGKDHVKEAKRLNRAKTIEEIDRELARLIVAYKLDDEVMLADAKVEGEAVEGEGEDEEEVRVEEELSEEQLAAMSEEDQEKHLERLEALQDEEEDALDEEEANAREREFKRVLGDEYEQDMEFFTKQHLYDLKQTLGDDAPETDIHDEGFEAFRDYADELVRAGGAISYTYTAADKTDRKMKLPFPLATKKLLKSSLDRDKKSIKLADQAPVTAQVARRRDRVDPEVYGAHAWLALAKNPSMGETERLKFTEALMDKLRELQGDEPVSKKGGEGPKQQKAKQK